MGGDNRREGKATSGFEGGELRFSPEEIRLEPNKLDGSPGTLVGYAARFNSRSKDLGGFLEMVLPGAFAQSIKDGDDVRAKYNHEDILGRTKNGTLRLCEDDKGLRFELDLPATNCGRDMAELVKRGDLDGCSFAFRVRQPEGDAWGEDEDGRALRKLRAVELKDVSVVDHPAYPETSVAVRALGSYNESKTKAVKPKTSASLARARLAVVKARGR